MEKQNNKQKQRYPKKEMYSFKGFSLGLIFFGMILITTGCGINLNNVEDVPVPDWVDVQLIDIDWASRRGRKLEAVNDIVIHYVGNPGSTAQQNRDYFASPMSNVSSHFIVGFQGEVIQCVPLDEYSSASNWRNNDTISIEVTHPDETGKFTQETYDALVRLTAWLCHVYELDTEHIIRHYDVTGKECPRYFVEHEDEWDVFKADVKLYGETIYY